MEPDPLRSTRATRARIAALTLHGKCADPSAHTAPARAAFYRRFELEADPEMKLPADVRAARADRLHKAHMLGLAMKSSKARKARRAPAA